MDKQTVCILLVEDEAAHAELVGRAFAARADQVHLVVAGSLAEAQACQVTCVPDLIITDWLLPDGQGTDFLSHADQPPDVPVVVMTSHGDEQVAVEAMKAGALDYVVKSPETLADMPHIAERALREWEYLTDRKQAEEALRRSEQRFRAIFEQAAVGVAQIVSKTGEFVHINHKYCDIVGYTREEMIHKTFQEITHPDDLQADLDNMKRLLEGKIRIFSMEKRYFRKDGSIIWVNLTVSPMWEVGGEPDYHIAVVEDISERKQMEEALQKAHDDLEKQVEERTTELRVANAELARVSSLKDEFLANMSHELRSPLNTILGFTDLMRREAGTGRQTLTLTQQEHLSLIHRSGEHLLALINNVLDLSKIESGRITLSPTNFEISRLVAELEDMFVLRAKDKQVSLQFECRPQMPQFVRTDEVKLRQVLINLLSNALKFTQEGGITLRVSRKQKAESRKQKATIAEGTETAYCLLPTAYLSFEVEDTGPGIAPEELDTLFEAFAQTATGQAVHEGTGLGLAISRQFVRLMGGELTVQSTVGQGSVFQFTIPVEVVEVITVTPKPFTRRVIGLMPGQPCYRILIVDDNAHNRQLLINILQPLGFELQAAADGQEAIELWQQWQPHLIWMDMRMPVLNGYEATKRIKATPQGQQTRILALTASSFEEERAVVLAAGCDDFLRKPFRETDLLEMMGRHLGVRYVYEEAVKEEQEGLHDHIDIQALTPKLASLPTDLLSRLEVAAIQARMNDINVLIEVIRSYDAIIAEALAALADNFEYPRIVTLIQATKQRSTGE